MKTFDNSAFIRIFKVAGILAVLASLVACGNRYPNRPFSMMEDAPPIKVSSIAVIAATNNDATKQLAESMTKDWSKTPASRLFHRRAFASLYAAIPLR